MIDIGYVIPLNKKKKLDISNYILFDSFCMIFMRRLKDNHIYLKPEIKIVTGDKGIGMLIIFLNYEEHKIEIVREIIDDINTNWSKYLTEDIFVANKTITLKNLIKADERLEFRLIWNKKQTKLYGVVQNPTDLIPKVSSLTFAEFSDYSSKILCNVMIEITKLSI
jgi:hypothetical protein